MKKMKRDFSTNYMGVMNIFFIVATFGILLFFLIGTFVLPDESDRVKSECQAFTAEWKQVLENGENISVEIPGRVEAESGEVVTLTTTLPHEIIAGENICFKAIWQDVEIYIDGILRQSYNTKESRPFGINSAQRYVFVELTQADAGKELSYCFSSKSKYAGYVDSVYVGDRASIWFYLIGEAGSRLVIAVFLLIISLFCIIICFIFRVLYKKRLALMQMAWAIFFSVMWILSQVEIRQLLFQNVSLVSSYAYWSLILISFPTLLCMNEHQKGRYQKLYSISLTYSLILCIVGTILQVLDIVQFVQMVSFIHLGTILANGGVIVTITIDIYNRKIKDYLLVGIGFYGVMVTTIMELVLYYVEPGSVLGSIFIYGLAFILMMAILDTVQELLHTEKKRQQAIAAKEAQTQFLTNMSHEIRTPINAIIGMNEMIMRENKNEEIQKYAHNIKSASDMLLGLISDVLDFSKIESGQLELVEDSYCFATLLQDEMVLLEARAAGTGLITKLEIDPDIPAWLYGDELRIKQILTNLLSNAVKYTKEGSITLKANFQWKDDNTIELCLAVRDTGIGIRKEDLSKIFDSFKRLDLNRNRTIEGTGLGLNIAKRLVELMQGNIVVESEYGKGSNFTVFIPQKVMEHKLLGDLTNSLDTCRLEKDAVIEEIFTAPEAAILVVDDNAMNLSVIKSLLKRSKIRVDFATSGRECLALTKHKEYHMILLDHMMPELDGIETLRILRADLANPNRKTTVIALTANASAGSREMYLKHGFDNYCSKPIDSGKLERLLMHHLPKELICMEKDLLYIDRAVGISYCSNSEEMYRKILTVFCRQVLTYLPQLDTYFHNQDWNQYAMIAHALKGNALNIGAKNFSALSLQHEWAAKEENIDFIVAEYANYIEALKKLSAKIDQML